MGKLEKMLEIVRTTKETYVGYVTKEDEKYLYLTHAAIISDSLISYSDIAFHYFCEKAKKQTRPHNIPYTAIESRTEEPQITSVYNTYESLSKVAIGQTSGKIKIFRLKKMLNTSKT